MARDLVVLMKICVKTKERREKERRRKKKPSTCLQPSYGPYHLQGLIETFLTPLRKAEFQHWWTLYSLPERDDLLHTLACVTHVLASLLFPINFSP